MANCRACGGVLGRDCYNEQDCLEISRAEQFNGYRSDEAEHYISILIYKLEQNGISIPNSFSAEPPLIFKEIRVYGCENKYIDDGLPF